MTESDMTALIDAENGAFEEWSSTSAHLIMRARSFGRHHLTDEEVESLAPLRAALDAAIATRRAAEAWVRAKDAEESNG